MSAFRFYKGVPCRARVFTSDEYKGRDNEKKEQRDCVMLDTTRVCEGSGENGGGLGGGSGMRLLSIWQPEHVSDAMTSDRSDCRPGVAPR